MQAQVETSRPCSESEVWGGDGAIEEGSGIEKLHSSPSRTWIKSNETRTSAQIMKMAEKIYNQVLWNGREKSRSGLALFVIVMANVEVRHFCPDYSGSVNSQESPSHKRRTIQADSCS